MEFYNLGNYLKKRRVEVGLTQKELAHKIGDLNSQFVSNWERGLCAPPGHSFQKIIELLKADRNEVVEVMLIDSRRAIESKVFPSRVKAKKLA